MKQYDCKFLTPEHLVFEEGTQQALALVQRLRQEGLKGWHVVNFDGEADDDFFVILERELPDVC